MKRIERPTYLDELISARGDGNIKVISGLRRCGKSYLLKHIFKDWLIADGVPANHILLYDLENRRNKHLLDPDVLMDTIESKITDDEIYFILIDEVQKLKEFTEVLESLLLIENAEVYVTGSNSKFLSKDIVTEFRGRATESHMYPLSFAEFLTAYDGPESESFLQYINYGGLPQILTQATHAKKAAFLSRIYKTVYLKDIYERYTIEYPDEFEELVKVLASSIGTPTNPLNLANTFKSKKHLNDITDKTVSTYISYIEDAFLVEKAERYYIQSAWRMPDEEKEEQESRPFRSISDSFKKIIVTGENVLLKRDESGVVTIPVTQFLKDPNSLDL